MNRSLISLILCIFGFLKEFRPSEPFVTNYLSGPWKNFTQDQINQEIYPIGTYSNFASLILVFLLVDLIKYKFAIILCGISGTVTFIILILSTTIHNLQIVECLYGLFLSTEVAYYTYIYAKVNKQYYQQVTSYTKCAYLLGRFSAGIVGQLTTSFEILDYEQLNYITIISLAAATLWSCLLPSVNQSIYFHRVDYLNTDAVISIENEESNTTYSTFIEKTLYKKSVLFFLKLKHAYYLLWQDFIKAYTNRHVIKWSFWWSFATCGYFQVTVYIQLLWENAIESNKENNENHIYNGLIEAVHTIISALVVFGIGNLHLNWPLIGETVLSIFSIVEGILLIISYISYNIWVLYSVYISFGVIYHSIITIASSEIVKYLSEGSYGLIIGINTFLALSLQSILTFLITSKTNFDLNIKFQYLVYGGYFFILGIIFIIMSVFTFKHYIQNKKPLKIWLNST